MEFRVLNIIDTMNNGKFREMIRNDFEQWMDEVECRYEDDVSGMEIGGEEEEEVIDSNEYYWLVGKDESCWWEEYSEFIVDKFILKETDTKSVIFRTLFKLEGTTELMNEIESIDEWMNQ